jgi:glycosyltransferase involved in cell wall biosynthesis
VIALPLKYSNRSSLRQRAFIFLKFAWRSTAVALREKHDVIFATSTPLTAGIPGIVAKLLGRKAPFVFEVRDLWPELPRALGMKNPVALAAMSLLEWLSYRTSDACVGLSPGIVEGIRRRVKSDHRIGMIANGCDLDLFRPGKQSGSNIPNVGPADFVAGFTGAHGIANGLDSVLDGAAELKRRGRTDIKIVLIGDGNQKDRLVRRARDENLNNVIFLPPVPKANVAQITANFDCGLMILANVRAFYYGTSPNKFFDYISAGLPVVNNYPGWLADLITANQCGLPVPPDDSGAFADALAQLADEPAVRTEMGRNARLLAEREFSREMLAKNFTSLLEAVVAPSHERRLAS